LTLTVPPKLPASEETAPRPIRVLIADDSSAMRTLARALLPLAKGFSVVVARDGAEALAMFDSHRLDCVVLDIEMPGMGGFEALEELQRRRPEVPVVVLSGFSDPVVAGEAKARGAAAYLDKGSEMGRLAETVRRVCGPSVAVAEPDNAPGPIQSRSTTGDDSSAAVELAAELRRLEYVISHDFAEPVRIMGGFATLLNKRYPAVLDASGQAFLAHLVDGARRMQTMVDDLLSYSRAGRAVAHPELIDLAQLVAEVIAEVPPAERPVEVTAGRLPSAWGDVTMLRTVLREVVTNGLRFNTAASPSVQIAGRVVNTSCVLTVTDNGIGVSPVHANEVFELFRRLNPREEHAGTGTGLALCQRLLALQSGSITLSPTAAGGTVVTITLPAAAPSSTNPPRNPS